MTEKNNYGDELFKDLSRSEHIEFPVSFDLKVVMDATISDDDNRKELELSFKELEIPFLEMKKRLSSRGRYVSFTYNVYIQSHEKLKSLYSRLSSIPGIKFAV